ncbi:MAG: EscU/YscU/HrcU family type III secretion system export apparatus switch protein [Acidobacteriota bacterium]
MRRKRDNKTEPPPIKAAALRYEPGKESAPKLLAKGQGHVADRILEIARNNQIPVHEDPALIEILSTMDLHDQIPPECYRVVAEILAFIYRTQSARAR